MPTPTTVNQPEPSKLADQGRLAAARKRSQTVDKIERAKRVISAEIEKHGGVYPYQGGRLTAAEVLRRAGLDGRLLAKPRHRQLRDEVNRWVLSAKEKIALGARSVRKAVTQRVTRSETDLELIRQQYAEAELEYVEQANEIERLKARCQELELELQNLKKGSCPSKVLS